MKAINVRRSGRPRLATNSILAVIEWTILDSDGSSSGESSVVRNKRSWQGVLGISSVNTFFPITNSATYCELDDRGV